MTSRSQTTTAPGRRFRPARLLGLCLAASVGLSAVGASTVSWIRLKPARTRVGLASVHLLASDLAVSGTDLTGTYRIRVPLAPWEDDRGVLRLKLGAPLTSLSASGGHATGTASSEFNGKTHAVDCQLEPDGDVRIVVVTDRRRLSFDTRYEGLTSASN